MDFYRGDGRNHAAVKDGFEARERKTADQARNWLGSALKANPQTVSFGLRLQSNPSVVATAASENDALDGKNFFYKITLPDDEFSARQVTSSGELGRVMPLADAARTEKYFVIFDNPFYEKAETIAFFHNQNGNKEVDFLCGIPGQYLSGVKPKSTGGRTPPFAKLPKPTNLAA